MTTKRAEHIDGLLQTAGVQAVRVRAAGTTVTVSLPFPQHSRTEEIMHTCGYELLSEGPGKHLDGKFGYRMKFRTRNAP